MSLEAFRKPAPVTFKVEGEVFRAELPTRWNKPYARAWQTFLSENAEIDGEGNARVKNINPFELQDAQIKAFVEHCIIESPISKEDLLGDYVMLATALFDAAIGIANEEEDRAEALVGKLSPTLNGAAAGRVKSASTRSSRKQAGLPPAT